MKTIQITNEALHNAHEKGCKEVKETLEILFPEEFKKKSEVDWVDVFVNPTKYIRMDDRYNSDVLTMHPKLAKVVGFGFWDASNVGYPAGWKGAHCTLSQLVDYLKKVLIKYEENL